MTTDNAALQKELLRAVENNDGELVKELLKQGADLKKAYILYNFYNFYNLSETLLHYVAREGGIEIAELLLECGAEVDGVDDQKKTPLHIAVLFDKPEMAKLLLENGATVDRKSEDGRTPLHCAASGGEIKSVELLLAYGATVDARDADGRTPLQNAFCGGESKASIESWLSVAQLLINKGADVEAKTKEGEALLDFVSEKNYESFAELIKNSPQIRRKPQALFLLKKLRNIAVESIIMSDKAIMPKEYKNMALELWVDIAKHLLGGDIALNNNQMARCIHYAFDRETLSVELEKEDFLDFILKNKPLPKTSQENIQIIEQWISALSRGVPTMSGGLFIGQKPRPYRELNQHITQMKNKILPPSQCIKKICDTLRNMGLEKRFNHECASEIAALTASSDAASHKNKLSSR